MVYMYIGLSVYISISLKLSELYQPSKITFACNYFRYNISIQIDLKEGDSGTICIRLLACPLEMYL